MWFPSVDQKSFRTSLSSVIVFETRPILLKDNLWTLGLFRVDPELRWIFGKTLSPPNNLIGFSKFSPLFGVMISFADASKFSPPQICATRTSPFPFHPAYNAYPKNIPSRTFLPNWWRVDWWFAEIGLDSVIGPNKITGPLNGSPNHCS